MVFHPRITQENSIYMWFKVRVETGRPFYIAICYFSPSTSHYASPKGQSIYMILYEDIWELSRYGNVILLGDFNAKRGHSQTVFYDTSEETLRELDANDMGLARRSQDEDHTGYGGYLINMGTTHGLAILNGQQRFPASSGFTCFPHRHGASTVDYVLAQPNFIPSNQDFTVGHNSIGVAVDHALLMFIVSFEFSTAQLAHRHLRIPDTLLHWGLTLST